MKKIILIPSLCLASMFAMAQHDGHNHAPGETHEATAPAKPLADGIEMTETEHDFGKIPQGKPVTHVFKVKNISTQAFKLDNVQASCGCTTPQWEREKSISPGETVEITVGYNAAAEGSFAKPITITYNGTQTKVINIKGEVWKTPTNSAPTNEGLGDLKN